MTAFKGILTRNEKLARYTSWHVGGHAKQTYRPENLADLKDFLATLPATEEIVWLGLGSNVLIRDGGINATVILTQGRLNQLSQNENIIRAEAGVTCAKMAKHCAKQGFAAAAFFAGVPGTVGGALAMNAGAFGGETWKNIVTVETINRRGEIKIRPVTEFQVGYRHVVRPLDEWFVAGHFIFAQTEDERAAAEKIRELLKKRSDSQPIGQFNCGSVFRNPPGDHAARLIETAGLKGFRLGGAWVSEKHANFIINGGDATATEIETLILLVQEKVAQMHGIKLIPEVHIIGSPLED